MAAAGFAGGLAGLGLTAAFAVGVAFLGDERRTNAFFAGFFLAVAVFLRVVALVTGISCALPWSCLWLSFLSAFRAS